VAALLLILSSPVRIPAGDLIFWQKYGCVYQSLREDTGIVLPSVCGRILVYTLFTNHRVYWCHIAWAPYVLNKCTALTRTGSLQRSYIEDTERSPINGGSKRSCTSLPSAWRILLQSKYGLFVWATVEGGGMWRESGNFFCDFSILCNITGVLPAHFRPI
jgi:hypothetical protein